MKIKTIVVDPKFENRQALRSVIKKHQEFNLSGAAWDGRDAKHVISKIEPDLLFLNTDLPDQSGFSFLDGLSPDKRPQIVMMSTTESHAMQALQYSALDFLKLPLDPARINRTLTKISKARSLGKKSSPNQEQEPLSAQENNRRIPIRNGRKVIFLQPENIHFVKGSGYYLEINTVEKKYLIRESMTSFLERLPSDQFTRIHRSVIVNLDQINEIIKKGPKAYYARLDSASELRISSTYRKALFEKLSI